MLVAGISVAARPVVETRHHRLHRRTGADTDALETRRQFAQEALVEIDVVRRLRLAEPPARSVAVERDRSERFGEKLATPDTSVGDLVGDVDPVKVAEGRSLGDSETIHYGLVPRTNRGIFAINELPDLAERIQVGLLNVLEERDVQIRGYKIRLPLDVLLVASAILIITATYSQAIGTMYITVLNICL